MQYVKKSSRVSLLWNFVYELMAVLIFENFLQPRLEPGFATRQEGAICRCVCECIYMSYWCVTCDMYYVIWYSQRQRLMKTLLFALTYCWLSDCLPGTSSSSATPSTWRGGLSTPAAPTVCLYIYICQEREYYTHKHTHTYRARARAHTHTHTQTYARIHEVLTVYPSIYTYIYIYIQTQVSSTSTTGTRSKSKPQPPKTQVMWVCVCVLCVLCLSLSLSLCIYISIYVYMNTHNTHTTHITCIYSYKHTYMQM